MAQAAAETDTRNLHWKQNNVGSTLLQKMGWKQGTAIGSKRLQKEDGDEVSGEGLKITKRPDGLGLGAARKPNVETTGHDTFHQLLQNLKKDHPSSEAEKDRKKKKRKTSDSNGDDDDGGENKKKKKRETIFATNKITNARVRMSKFSAKNPQDMACIFGKDYSSAEIASKTLSMVENERNINKKKSEKKRKEAQRDENSGGGNSSNNGDNINSKAAGELSAEQKQERKRKRKKEKEEKRRRQQEEKLKSLEEA